ncbi:Gfo/Idh/MocA family oxidoreductase [Acidobacteria bacterium AH-259-O06]|nr:Gfo/Idh/MocA family oxidoreductase [Acidobacteria bacterium AH-259-O06]
MVDSEKGFAPCPDSIAVIGGGRWARVLTEVLCGLVPPSVGISVHSLHNAESVSTWASARGFGQRIRVLSELPQPPSLRSSAVIVANAARDHESAVEWALSAGVPVLVEKPIALTAAASQRLADLAHIRNTRFAAAHIFLFSRYLEKFSKLVADAGNVRSLRVHWMDPQYENRYGEHKQYDPGLPVFADWLPHVLSIVGTLAPSSPERCEKLEFLRGGAHLELELMLGNVPCSVQLVRNGDRRERIIEVAAEKKTLQLDFSREPGTIISGSMTMNGDPDWEVMSRPATRMLTAFLLWVVGEKFDSRLDIEIGLRASRVIDQTWGMYRSALMPWLIARLPYIGQIDDDLRYALTEVLHFEGPLSTTAMEQQIERLRQQFSGTDGTRWLRELAEAQEPATLLRALAA